MKQIPTVAEVLEQVNYDPDTGEFRYLSERWVDRKFAFQKAVEPKPVRVQVAGERADKEYGTIRPFIGVYIIIGTMEKLIANKLVLRNVMKVVSASALAVYITDGYWPGAVLFADGNYKNIRRANLTPITKSDLGCLAAENTHKHERSLPPNVYGTSSGKFIGRKGKRKTLIYTTSTEAASAVSNNQWV